MSFAEELAEVSAALLNLTAHEHFATMSVQLMTFDSSVDVPLPFSDMSHADSVAGFRSSVEGLGTGSAGLWGTSTYRAFRVAHQALDSAMNNGAISNGKPNKIVPFTDGMAHDYRQRDDILSAIRSLNIPELTVDVITHSFEEIIINCDFRAAGI